MGKKGADLNSFYEDSMASYYIFSSGLNIHWILRNVFRSLSRLQTVQFSRKKKDEQMMAPVPEELAVY